LIVQEHFMTSSPTFGALLRQLRKRAGMTQSDLAAAVGYSVSFVSDLEQNRRLPAVAVVLQQFIPALGLQEEAGFATHLVELAALARGERPPPTVTLQRTAQVVVSETFTIQSSRLPAPPTALIGREQEIKTICNRLPGHSGRLLTLVGPPGVGKTRLALAVASHLEALFKDGARFIPLAALSDPELLASTLGNELELLDTGKLSPQERLVQDLRQKELLLVLDNFEQILAAAPLLATVLTACPRVYLLVTSRERLHLRAEQRFPVPPLDLAFAVALFVQRAQAVDPAFTATAAVLADIQAICQRLDCLPLAIELSAAHIDLFSPQMMLARLQDRGLDLLDDGPGDAPEHHHTLRKSIHRSYALLAPEEQRLFRTLGVFVGGFDLEAVVGLGYAEQTLQTLVNRSMVRIEAHLDSEPRGLLLETLREYAREQLVVHRELAAVQQQHAHYFLACAECHCSVDTTQKHLVWLSNMDRNLNNLQAAFLWALEARQVETALRLMAALYPFWEDSDFRPWTRRLYQAVLSLADQEWALEPAALHGSLDPEVRQRIDLLAYGLLCAGEAVLSFQWDAQVATELLQRSSLLDRMTGVKEVTLLILFAFAYVARLTYQYERVAELCNEVLDLLTSVVDINEWTRKQIRLRALIGLSECAMDLNDPAQLESLSNQMLPLIEELDDQGRLANIFVNQGDIALFNGEISRADEFLQRSLTYQSRRNSFHVYWVKYKLGIVALHKGNLPEAQTSFVGFIHYLRANYGFWNISYGFWGLADLAIVQQRSSVAAQLLGAADHLRQLTPDHFPKFFHRAYAATIAAARAQLDETTYASAYAEGYAMTPDQAVAFALAQFDGPENAVPQSKH
jgi:predicted ATPase/transcriptional regulator with XRE-family HTH domain